MSENQAQGVVDAAAAAIRKHRLEPCSIITASRHEYWGRCTGCGFEGFHRTRRGPEWELNIRDDEAKHQARVVQAVLGLTEETRTVRSICDMADPGIDEHRVVSPWVSVRGTTQ